MMDEKKEKVWESTYLLLGIENDDKKKEFRKLWERINSLFGNVKFVDKPSMPCVPKSIGIFGRNDCNSSAVILNLDEKNHRGENQGLWKVDNDSSFNICYFSNCNTGLNYTFKKVSKPEPNKLIYCTDDDDMSDITNRHMYKVFLTEDDYARFVHGGGVGVASETWKHYYEIVPKETK